MSVHEHYREIYLAQHGLAIDKKENPERPLSSSGIMKTAAIARLLRDSAIHIKHICHSGKIRAEQTALIFAAEFTGADIHAVDYLSPNEDIKILADKLHSDASTNHTLYIGHLPHLDKLSAYLLSGQEAASHMPSYINFQNSAVVCLRNKGLNDDGLRDNRQKKDRGENGSPDQSNPNQDDSRFQLRWYLTPDLLPG
jgi:phosphohistidine phosphatase